jgi:hypothetical protein
LERQWRVLSRPDGSRDLVLDDADGARIYGKVDAQTAKDLDHVLDASSRKSGKDWEDVPESVAKSIPLGQMGFPERIANAWRGGWAGVAESLTWDRMLHGELTGEQAAAQAAPELLKARLDEDPVLAWKGTPGATLAEYAKHPVRAAEEAAVGFVHMQPLMADLLLHGPAEAAQAPMALGAGVARFLTGGKMEPEKAAEAVGSAMALGVAQGTAVRAMRLFSGQAAAEMNRMGLDDEAVKKYAPLVGAGNAALTAAQFALLSPEAQAVALEKVLGSKIVKDAAVEWMVKYAGGVAAFGGLGGAQEAVSTFFNNAAAVASHRPDLLVSGPEAGSRVFMATLKGSLQGAFLNAPGAAAEALGGRGAEGAGTAASEKPSSATPGEAAGVEKMRELSGEGAPREVEGKPTTPHEFFSDSEIKAVAKETPKKTAEDLRYQMTGERDQQVQRVNVAMRKFEQEVPDTARREAILAMRDTGGDAEQLRRNADDPTLPEWFRNANAAAAEGLFPKEQEWLGTIDRYFKEAFQVGAEKGTLSAARENYINRVYQPEGEGETPRTEAGGTLRPRTSHALERSFETMADAMRPWRDQDGVLHPGKQFAVTDPAELVRIYNSELATANASRSMLDSMHEAKIGGWRAERPDGWERVGELEKRVPIKDKAGNPVLGEDGNQLVMKYNYYAPKDIAKGLSAITDPNLVNRFEEMRKVAKYQGLVKTWDLSMSLFHHVTLAAQVAYAGDVKGFLDLGHLSERLEDPGFLERERLMIKHGLTTAITQDNMDIMRRLSEDPGSPMAKAAQLPGVKQVGEFAKGSAEFLFGKAARMWKVDTASRLAFEWLKDNPEATPEKFTEAMRGIARHVNDRFGGQNWEALGVSKTALAAGRALILAPDYFVSNLHMLRDAVLNWKGPEGSLSRQHIGAALASSWAAGQLMSYAIKGKGMESNRRGHGTEVEVAPDVYVTPFRGAPGEILKLGSKVAEHGLGGAGEYVQGKAAPFVRGVVGYKTKYSGAPVYKKTDNAAVSSGKVLLHFLANVAPVPFSLTNLYEYVHDGEPTLAGVLAVGTGIGRYSPASKKR